MGCGQSKEELTGPEELLIQRCRDLLEFGEDEPLGQELDLGGIGLDEIVHREAVAKALLSVQGRVRILDLGRNPYSEQHGLPEVLCLLDKVTELRLGKTTLTQLPKAVERWKLLERVELSGNQLGPTLPEQVWGWARAGHIDISSNRLATFPGEVNGWGALERLDASYNKLVSLPPGVGAWTQCTRLDLNNNELELLPEEFGLLAALRTLNFQNNELKVLPASFRQLTSLQELDLSHNEFRDFPESLGGLVSLRTLNFSHCKLDHVTVAIGGLRALEEVDFTSNLIREVDKHAFRELKGGPLRQVTLRENLLSLLPESMCVLSNLERLDVCFNQIHALGNFLAQCPKLVAISASHNEVSIIPPDFAQMTQLKVLDLRTNPLGLFPKWLRQRVGMPMDLTVKPDPEASYEGDLKLIWNRDVAAIEENRTMRRKMMNVSVDLTSSKGKLRHVEHGANKKKMAGATASPYAAGIKKSSSSRRKKSKSPRAASKAKDEPKPEDKPKAEEPKSGEKSKAEEPKKSGETPKSDDPKSDKSEKAKSEGGAKDDDAKKKEGGTPDIAAAAEKDDDSTVEKKGSKSKRKTKGSGSERRKSEHTLELEAGLGTGASARKPKRRAPQLAPSDKKEGK